MKFVKEHPLAIFILSLIIIIAGCCYISYLDYLTSPMAAISNIREKYLTDEYNKDESIFYLIYPSASFDKDKIIPWGINKSEAKLLQPGEAVYETDNCLIFGPVIYGEIQTDKGYFIEYHFNKDGQLYKIVETNALKYVLVEYNECIANMYNSKQYYELYNSDFPPNLYGIKAYFVGLSRTRSIKWKDKYGIERSAVIDKIFTESYSYINYLQELTGLNIKSNDSDDIEPNKDLALENDFEFTTSFTGKEKSNVSYNYVTKKISDKFVLSEGTLINSALEDK